MDKAARFAGRLRELREGQGWTQGQLAEMVNVKREAVARWEAGVREPGWSYIIALADALGVDCRTFLEEPADRPPPAPGRPVKQKDEGPEGQAKHSRGRPAKVKSHAAKPKTKKPKGKSKEGK
jgi:transcriptional regulator with XRE-family HTH domain